MSKLFRNHFVTKPPTIMTSSRFLTIPVPDETASSDLNNQLSIRSLSELYLSNPSHSSSLNPLLNRNINPLLSNALLNNLRNRLNEQIAKSSSSTYYDNTKEEELLPTSPSSSSSTQSASSEANSKSSPLSTLFHPPGHFLSKSSVSNDRDPENPKPKTEQRRNSEESYHPTRARRIQRLIYEFLNHPNTPIAIIYHLILSLLFLIYVFLVIFTDRTTWHQYCKPFNIVEKEANSTAGSIDLVPSIKSIYERCLLAHFVVFGYFIRLFASRSQPSYEPLPKWKWILRYHYRLSHLFDLTIVVAGVIASSCQIHLTLDFTQDVYALIVLRGLHRLFNVAQWSSVRTRHSPWTLMAEVFQEQGSMLFGIFYLESLLVFVMAYFVYLAENHTKEEKDNVTIENMVDALYWSSVTLVTVGYGDNTPVTYLGKAITSIGLVIGLGLFALPSGIIATSLAIKLNEQDEIRSRSERRNLAATLIQRVWRFQRRKKRFELANIILETRAAAPVNQEAKMNTAPSSATQQVYSPNIRIGPRLYDKLLHLVTRKIEFHQTQFIDLIRIQQSRRKFVEMIKRANAIPSNTNRHLIKQHWIEHKNLTELLESMHNKLDEYISVDSGQSEYDKSLDIVENRLKRIHLRMENQRKLLESLNVNVN